MSTATPPVQDAAYWKERYEQERERLVKLWVAYKTLEESLVPPDEAARAEKMPPAPEPSDADAEP